jgi:hypothetical protein
MISFYTWLQRPFHPSPQRILKSTLRFKVEDRAPTIKKMPDLLDNGEDESLPIIAVNYPRKKQSCFTVSVLTTVTSAEAAQNSFCSRQVTESFAPMYVMSLLWSCLLTIIPDVCNYARAFCITKLRTSFQCVSVVGEYVEGYQLR